MLMLFVDNCLFYGFCIFKFGLCNEVERLCIWLWKVFFLVRDLGIIISEVGFFFI